MRESILDPNAKIVAGFEPNVMPNFKGQVSEEECDSVDRVYQIAAPQQPARTSEAAQPAIIAAPGASCAADDGSASAEQHVKGKQQVAVRDSSNGWQQLHRNSAGSRRSQLPERRTRLEVVAVHHRPQADRDAVPDLDHADVLCRRLVRGADPDRPADAGRRSVHFRTPTTSCSRCTASSWCSSS